MSVRYSDRCSERYSRSLSEVKGSQSETEAETEVNLTLKVFMAEPVSERRSAKGAHRDGLALTFDEGEAR
jgi:hypothetical protein